MLVESSVVVIFYVIFLMCYAVIINYSLFWNIFFPIKRKQGVRNCFKPLISPLFTAVFRLKSEQNEKKIILTLIITLDN